MVNELNLFENVVREFYNLKTTLFTMCQVHDADVIPWCELTINNRGGVLISIYDFGNDKIDIECDVYDIDDDVEFECCGKHITTKLENVGYELVKIYRDNKLYE